MNLLQRASAIVPLSLRRFLVTGGLTVALDALVYSILLHFHVAIPVAKVTGLLCATAFAFVANRFWAFAPTRARALSAREIVQFLVLYALAIALNAGVNSAMIALLGTRPPALFAAWLAATAASSSFNYVGLRFVVFR